MKRLLLLAGVVASGAGASSSSSWAADDRAAAVGCIKASQFRAATATPANNRARFGDDIGFDALLVTGTFPQPHMRGQIGTVLCLWERGARKAHVSEVKGWKG